MRIFHGFLIILTAVILFMLPITSSIYDYRTDLREDEFSYETGGAETTANVTLLRPIYDNDTGTIDILSDLGTDIPVFASYNTTTRILDMTGMTLASNRTLTVFYDINALVANLALSSFLDWLPYIWIILIGIMPLAGIYAIIRRRA